MGFLKNKYAARILHGMPRKEKSFGYQYGTQLLLVYRRFSGYFALPELDRAGALTN
jgi:hypothetical protein